MDKNEQSMNSEEMERAILQPYYYIVRIPGKQIRTKLAEAFNYWLKISPEKCQAVTEIVQMLHNSSLLIDDIEDNSLLRRGVPVAHHIFGVASTINSANYVYFLSLEKCLQLGDPRATTVFTEQCLELHRGQGMEIYWRDNYICPSEDDYITMVKRKTGGLFGLAVRLMQLFSENKSDFSELIGTLGLYFQIRDDYANLVLKEYTDNKSFAEDLTEGKFSFPIIHAIQKHPEDPRMMNIVKKRTKDLEIKKYAVDVLEKLGSFAYTKEVLKKLDAEARREAEKLGGNPYIVQVLDELKNW
ncbi:terpene synthase-like isoform X3 [Dermacentor silvarum]|uniref:terpene synthase-like isoform X3 n=1 Tax=Dermacentor silvarum TaxID=543639 RepID=UPI00189B1421|nr:terpene synthase-like isoform X3 [Dermacentor silvarum]